MEKLPFLHYKDHSSLEFCLLIEEKDTYKGAARDVTYTSVAGRSGDLITDNGRYKNVKLSYKLALLNTSPHSFNKLVRLIKQWLYNGGHGYFKLWDSYDGAYYRLASLADEINVEQELAALGSLSLKFNCKPYKYSFEGETAIQLTQAGSIYNAEAYESKPYIKIYGNGGGTLYINNKAYNFTSINSYIEVDSELMNAYKGTTPANNQMQGSGFPTLQPGYNNISWSGNITALEIVPRWCTL